MFLSVAAVVRDAVLTCHACTTVHGLPVSILGSLAYAALLASAWRVGPNRFVFFGIMVAVAVHTTLVGFMLLNGMVCVLCLLAAANSAGLLVLSLLHDPVNYRRAAATVPVTTLIAVGILIALGRHPLPAEIQTMSQAPATESTDTAPQRVRLVVFEKAGCPHCHELRTQLVPRLEKDFGSQLEIVYRDSSKVQGVVSTPTLVIVGDPNVIEGLPSYEQLHRAVEAMVLKKKSAPVSKN